MKIKLATLKKRLKNGDKIKAYVTQGEHTKIVMQGGNYALIKTAKADKYKSLIWEA